MSTITHKSHAKDKEVDAEVKYEFGGPVGVTFIIITSHLLLWYFWASLETNKGIFLTPDSIQDFPAFLVRLTRTVVNGAWPTWGAWKIYLTFMLVQAIFAVVLPGPIVKGLPIPSEKNRQLEYKCNGVAAWYASLAGIAILNYTGLFKFSTFMDLLGPLTTVSMIAGDVVTLSVYFGAKIFDRQHRMSGSFMYDLFMGAWLNPRIPTPLGEIDLKMWAEIRVSWILLFILTVSAAFKQYETQGAVSLSMWLMITAHALYANACMKGEECIPTTFDIFYEKWGWMLTFWNLAGVPFLYTAQSIYVLKHNPTISTAHFIIVFCLLIGAYFVWDTANSQKNRFRMQRRGTYVPRTTFPQLPWGTLEHPKFITTKHGNDLLVDGWWKYARKIHYTADLTMALCWGLSCGFDSILPFFYFCFFLTFLSHRGFRDNKRCAKKYGADWADYCKRVPYTFIPGLI